MLEKNVIVLTRAIADYGEELPTALNADLIAKVNALDRDFKGNNGFGKFYEHIRGLNLLINKWPTLNNTSKSQSLRHWRDRIMNGGMTILPGLMKWMTDEAKRA